MSDVAVVACQMKPLWESAIIPMAMTGSVQSGKVNGGL